MNFKGDNISGVHPKIFEAMQEANSGFDASYGEDKYTEKLNEVVNQVFEKKVRMFFAATGTSSNCLALSAVCPSFGTILCAQNSHINTKESNSIGLFDAGATLTPVSDDTDKVSPKLMEEYIQHAAGLVPHESKPFVVSITEITEAGVLYTIDEIKAISEVAHKYGLKVHMDGSRFANALATLNCTPSELSWKAGVDVISLGGTKNGCLLAELVIFFDDSINTEHFGYMLKRSGQLLSKSRFFSAQLIAYFKDNLWIENARNANKMAKMIADTLLAIPGSSLITPVDGNEVFVKLPSQAAKYLKEKGIVFGVWDVEFTQFRFLASWNTTEENVNILKENVKHFLEAQ